MSQLAFLRGHFVSSFADRVDERVHVDIAVNRDLPRLMICFDPLDARYFGQRVFDVHFTAVAGHPVYG